MFACGCVFVCRLIWCLFSVLFKLFGLLFVSVVFVFVGRVFVSGLFVSAFCMFVCALDFAFLFLLSLWFCYISVGFNFFSSSIIMCLVCVCLFFLLLFLGSHENIKKNIIMMLWGQRAVH